MQADASNLDTDRAIRLKAIAAQEARDREVEDRARERSGKVGGKGEFVAGMQRKAGEMGLGERMKRGRGGYEKVGADED